MSYRSEREFATHNTTAPKVGQYVCRITETRTVHRYCDKYTQEPASHAWTLINDSVVGSIHSCLVCTILVSVGRLY